MRVRRITKDHRRIIMVKFAIYSTNPVFWNLLDWPSLLYVKEQLSRTTPITAANDQHCLPCHL